MTGELGRRPVIAAVLGTLGGLVVSGCSSSSSDGHHGAAAPTSPGGASSTHPGGGGAPNATVAENALPGDASWQDINQGPDRAIEGYADRISLHPGESFSLHVSTTAPGFTVTAFRMGWYGGAMGRAVWKSPRIPGTAQPTPAPAGSTRTVVAGWPPSLSVPTDGWPEGSYLMVLTSDAGYGRYVPVTLRSASADGRLLICNAVTTWQAYNTWGGYSLYQGPDGRFPDRSRAVSFDRPYCDSGAEKFLSFEQPLVAFTEKLGLPVAYATSLELANEPALFTQPRALLSPGHDEYWSTEMRATATAARDAGVNIAFLGANAIFRHVRFENNDRTMVCYKSATEDPLSKTDPTNSTQQWREAPMSRPENVLTGTYYEGNPVDAPFVVLDANAWMFAGTGAVAGTSFRGLVGPEYDRVVADPPPPRPLQVLSHSPLVCGGKASYANASYYTVASGAGVFSSGTMRWAGALIDGSAKRIDPPARTFVQKVTENILQVFAAGPAGRTHPAVDTLDAAPGATSAPVAPPAATSATGG